MISQITTYGALQRTELEDEINPWRFLFPLFILTMGIAFLALLSRKRDLKILNDPSKTETEQKIERMGFVRGQFPGRSRIFIHPNRPGELIKYSPSCTGFDLKFRLVNMESCRRFCELHCFRSLVVPEARVEGDYLRERRLPISESSQMGQIGLYLSNSESFSDAIAEFMKFLCLANFDDLLGSSELSSLSDFVNARYDNAPLYLEGGEGKIGLIDLESFSLREESTSPSLEHIKSACITSVTFFPLHFDLILSIAESFDSNIRGERGELEQLQTKIMNYFEKSWVAHQRFLDANGITVRNPTKMVQMTPDIKLEIISSLRDKFYKPLGEPYREPDRLVADYFFSSEASRTAIESQLFPSIVDHVERFNQKRFNYLVIKKYHGEELSPYKLSDLRTVFISRESIPLSCQENYDRNEKLLIDIIADEISSRGLDREEFAPSGFARWVTDSIYLLLAEKGVIAAFRARVYGESDLLLL